MLASATDCISKKTLFINDLDEGNTNNISKFADAMKLVGNVSSGKDIKMFPSDFSKLSEWVNSWQMQYNVDKCEIHNFGWRNRMGEYYLNGNRFGNVDVCRCLGVLVHQTLKASVQVQHTVIKTNGMLAFIVRGLRGW